MRIDETLAIEVAIDHDPTVLLIAPPMLIRKPLTMRVILQKLGLLKQNETQYVKPAAAGPNNIRSVINPSNMSPSLVVSAVASKAKTRITGGQAKVNAS